MSKKPEQSSGEKVPLWIISFADMITLLLSFFVMLQTMAHAQDAKLMGISQQAFRRAINGLGMPDFLFGKQSQLDLEYQKLRHPTEESTKPNPEPARVIDADDERIRQLFDQIRKEMDASSSDKDDKAVRLVQTPIAFDAGSCTLSPGAVETLEALARALSQNQGSQAKRLTVVCWSGGEQSPRDQWLLSTRRAKEVELCLHKALAATAGKPWQFFSWGAGKEAAKSAPRGAEGGKSMVAIAVEATGE